MVSAARSDLSLPDGRRSQIGFLRQRLRAVEDARLPGADAPVTLGIPPIDAVLGGGLAGAALHEIAAAHDADSAAATAFALALTACRARPRHNNAGAVPPRCMLWVAEDLSRAEHGLPYGPGLDEAGIAPEQLITVAAAHAREVLWVMEEALRCRAVAVTIGEMRGAGIESIATRRLSLAAAAGNTFGLLLRTAPDDEPSAAATRWIIAAAPSSPGASGVGPPRLAVRLVRNRRGPLGAWMVEWNYVEQRFKLATHPEPVAGAAFDRPAHAAMG